MINLFIEWTKRTFLPYGELGLFLVAFMESSFFPVPPDLLLIVLGLAAPEKALWFALIATVGSVAGAIFGYGIGKAGGLPLLRKFVKEEKIVRVHNLFNKYESWTVAVAAITPIPYKLVTIAGGVFYIDFKKFIIISLLCRGFRFFLEALFVMFFGVIFVNFFDKYFEILTIILLLILIIGYFLYKKLNLSRFLKFLD